MTHLPLRRADTEKGVVQIDAGATIAAGITTANLPLDILKNNRAAKSVREWYLFSAHSTGQASVRVRASSRLPPMTHIPLQVISLVKISIVPIFLNTTDFRHGWRDDSLFL